MIFSFFRVDRSSNGRSPAALVRFGLCGLMAASLQTAGAQDPLDALAEELVGLRGQVESLNTDLNRLQERHRAEMNSLAAQKGDLEATRRREMLRIRQLEQDLADNRERAARAGVAGEALMPVAARIIASLQKHIESSFPFKIDERLKGLAEIRSQLESGATEPPRVINRLWRFYEDELRLTRDNGLYSQVIPIDGREVLADIAKIGAIAMYFQTRDGRLGHAVRNGDDWRFEVSQSAGDRQQIAALFDSLKKQIRTGYFELPNGSIRLEADS
ncbi:MAG: DUF3450 family protein [Wenzhouxiangellaceae bacterium]|nr:DUF3450 family protein [Wenzhouxiangellaceae bacterium]